MGGFLGVGSSGTEKRAVSNLDSVFNYGLTAGKAGESTGSSTLSDAAAAFKSLVSPGRAQASLNAAPAVNATKDQADAVKREEASTGTDRGGGTAAFNRESTATTTKNIDDIINQNLMGGKIAGAQGEEGVGSVELGNAANLLGLGTSAEGDVLKEGELQTQRNANFGAAIGKLTAIGIKAGLGL